MEDTLLMGLAQEHGTPLYVYDGDLVSRRFEEFTREFKQRYGKVRVCYAVKANSSLALLRLLARRGCGADVVSGGEIKIALDAGIRPEDIVYTSNSKSRDEIALAVESGVSITHGNITELDVCAEVAGELGVPAHLAFRVNPDVSARTHPKIATGLRNSKFGVHFEGDLAFNAYERASELESVEVIGLHCHIGSQITEADAFREAVSKMTSFAVRLERELGLKLEFIDVGGGLGISYGDGDSLTLEDYADIVSETFVEGIKDLSYEPILVLEPGRYLVGPAGVLLTSVNSVKRTPVKNFVNVDAGFNTFARPAMYDAYHGVKVLGKTGEAETYDIAGNICESGDILASDRMLPEVDVGDVVAILDAGAYGFSMASEYNMRPLPAEVLVRKGEAELIRSRRTVDEMLDEQRIPDDLK